jgi:hypothetical protein
MNIPTTTEQKVFALRQFISQALEEQPDNVARLVMVKQQADDLDLKLNNSMIQDMILEVDQDHYRTSVLVVVEDARQIGGPAHQKMGAGSIRRDCSIWDDFLVDLAGETDALEFIFVKPSRKGLRKLTQEQLTTYTGCELKGSQHARDAVGVIFPHL